MVVMVGCTPPGPLSEGEGPAHMTSPQPSPGGEGVASRALENIDSLMWWRADSALAVMMEFAGSEAADSLDVFNGHYCQLLIAELLFKNDYAQTNRTELLQAVAYFDLLVGTQGTDIRGTDTFDVSLQGRPCRDARHASAKNATQTNVFLDARAHYMNGVGFYERDSVVAACSEYLKALEIVETQFPGIETQDVAALQVEHLPRFMALTYGRLGDLFSGQFMQEPAIVCYKKSFVFSKIEPTSANGIANLMSHLGKQYDMLKQFDSAEYYYNEGLRQLVDTNNLTFRNLVSAKALLNYNKGNGVEPAVSDLKRMAAKAPDEDERLTRFVVVGDIYYDASQFDSALVYLTRVFENKDDVVLKRDAARCLRNIYQSRGDTLKATQYAMFQAKNAVSEGESNAQVSQLNEMFQQHLQWKQEKVEAERRQTEQLAARQRIVRGVVTAVVVLLVLGLGLWWWMAKRRKEHEAETQTLNEEKQQLQTQVDDALQQLQTVDDALQQLQTQADDALQQARAMLPQRVADLYRAKVPNRLERILAEFEAAYPKALERLAAAYPELSETERQIAVLNFLRFRAKEEAELMGFAENTILKYRSNLHKKAASDPISALIAE